MVTIVCNGRSTEVAYNTSIAQLIDDLGVGNKRFAVEVNREVVPRDRLAEVILAPGDEVNIVTLVGGG